MASRSPHATRRAAPTVPAHPRRVSGPIRPGHPRPATAVPQRVRVDASGVAAALPAPPLRWRVSTGAMRALRELPDHRLLDTLLRSRAWIWLLGIALGGVVAMQVSLLKMNAGIGVSVQRSTNLQHANAMLEEQVAELSSGERIQATAQRMGLIVPDAGEVGYLTVRPGIDAQQAARNMTAPSQAARDDLLAGGRTAATPVATPTPVTTATPVVTATPAPVATATPVPTAVAPVTATTTPTAGAVAAPSGQ